MLLLVLVWLNFVACDSYVWVLIEEKCWYQFCYRQTMHGLAWMTKWCSLICLRCCTLITVVNQKLYPHTHLGEVEKHQRPKTDGKMKLLWEVCLLPALCSRYEFQLGLDWFVKVLTVPYLACHHAPLNTQNKMLYNEAENQNLISDRYTRSASLINASSTTKTSMHLTYFWQFTSLLCMSVPQTN